MVVLNVMMSNRLSCGVAYCFFVLYQYFSDSATDDSLFMRGKFIKEIMIYCCCLVAKSCLTLFDPMDCSTPDLPVLHCLLEFA